MNEQAITLKLERAFLFKLQKWKIRNTAQFDPCPQWVNDHELAPGAIKKKKERERRNEISVMKLYGQLRSHRRDTCKWTLKY